MFDKFKQIKQLKELQDSLKKEEVIVEKDGVRVAIDGQMRIKELKLNPEVENDRQEKLIKDCFNEAIGELQVRMAKKMAGMPKMGF